MPAQHKFNKGQVVKFRGAHHHNLILKDPSTCLHNGEPSYQVLAVGSPHPFYRSQKDVEGGDWFVPPDSYTEQIIHRFDCSQVELHDAEEAMNDLSPSKKVLPTVTEFKFGLNDTVCHIKSGGLYNIVGTPNTYVIEATGEPAYAYNNGQRTFVRCQTEMEDGRFELTLAPVQAIYQ